jgi:cytochrome c-type biogenesis protein CcmH
MRAYIKRPQWGRGGALPRWLQAFSVTALVLASLLPLTLGATAAEQEAHVREIALELRCPICQGLSVGDSPSELANEMRALIREQLQQGKTPPQVLDYFAQRYGEWILLAPPKRGFNLIIWVLPFALLPIGAAVVYLGARRWVHSPTAEDPPTRPVESPYAERLQHELDSYQ